MQDLLRAPPMTKERSATLGLVAGLGVGAGIFYYRSLVNANRARGLSPHIVMVHADVRKVMWRVGSRWQRKRTRLLSGKL